MNDLNTINLGNLSLYSKFIETSQLSSELSSINSKIDESGILPINYLKPTNGFILGTKKWGYVKDEDQYKHICIKIAPGSSIKVKNLNEAKPTYIAALRTYTPPTKTSDVADYSEKTGWSDRITVAKNGGQFEGIFPLDSEWLYIVVQNNDQLPFYPSLYVNDRDMTQPFCKFADQTFSKFVSISTDVNELGNSVNSDIRKIKNTQRDMILHNSQSINQYDVNNAENLFGYVLNDSTGNITTNSGYAITHFIPCQTSCAIMFSYDRSLSTEYGSYAPIRNIQFFDSDLNRIDWKSSTAASQMGISGFTSYDSITNNRRTHYTYANASNCQFIKVGFARALSNDFMVQIEDQFYSPFYHIEHEDFIENTSLFYSGLPPCGWSNKTIFLDGDSIATNSIPKYAPDLSIGGPQFGYLTFVCNALHAKGINAAIGASTLAVNSIGQELSARTPIVTAISSDRWLGADEADCILIHAGTNDWQYSWSDFGDMESTSISTFYGAVKSICEQVLERYPGKPFCFITPIKRWKRLSGGIKYDEPNNIGKTLEDYSEAIKEVCKYYGVKVIDLFSECPINPKIESHFQNLIPDGTHPNYKGHQLISKYIAGALRTII